MSRKSLRGYTVTSAGQVIVDPSFLGKPEALAAAKRMQARLSAAPPPAPDFRAIAERLAEALRRIARTDRPMWAVTSSRCRQEISALLADYERAKKEKGKEVIKNATESR